MIKKFFICGFIFYFLVNFSDNEGMSEDADQDNFINIQGDDELLSFLYSKAFALVNTSRYEGFGITNIEAITLITVITLIN